jgi:hypothetical protein
MAVVNQVEKKATMTNWDVVKYQIVTHCYVSKIQVSEADLNCLTYLALEGEQELTSFCHKVHNKQIFSSPQSARNSITKCEKKKLIIKEGKNKKKIMLNPEINIVSSGNILLNIKILSLASKESEDIHL